jgi:hypothetical protein
MVQQVLQDHKVPSVTQALQAHRVISAIQVLKDLKVMMVLLALQAHRVLKARQAQQALQVHQAQRHHTVGLVIAYGS